MLYTLDPLGTARPVPPVRTPNEAAELQTVLARNLDLLLTDQSGIPTFVECKRYADTRSRREVVGQMLEYAANGHHDWDRAEIRRYIEKTAARAGQVRLRCASRASSV